MVKQADLFPWGYTTRAHYLQGCWARHRLTEERWWEFWIDQEAKCAGCKQPFAHPWVKEAKEGLKVEVDHCHKQELEDEFGQVNLFRVRGFLCRRCNEFLGKIRDNQDTLRRLAEYLKRHGESLENLT